jgi:CheY-like chemotaxis protein
MERMLRRLIGEDVEVVTRFAPQLALVRADLGQLEQVVLNLAVNARDAMPGGGTLTIETADVRLEDDLPGADRRPIPGDYVRVSVRDTGHGMDERTRAHVFEPFFTTKEPGKGTGLGLSTVYGIIAQSGGYLTVESSLGEGSTFAVYLPRVEEAAPALVEEEPTPPVVLTGSETILLVEDDEGVRAFAELLLVQNGYLVLSAGDGPDALHIAERHPGPIDLLLTDVVMPRIAGPQLADAVERLRPGVRVLYMSGYAGDTALGEAGGFALVPKPFTEEELLGMVREALEAPGDEPPVPATGRSAAST